MGRPELIAITLSVQAAGYDKTVTLLRLKM